MINVNPAYWHCLGQKIYFLQRWNRKCSAVSNQGTKDDYVER